MSEYPDTAPLVALSSREELTSLSLEDQNALRLGSIRAVEQFCGQPFETSEGSELVEGGGAPSLYLPKRLHELQALSFDGVEWPVESVVVSPDGSQISRNRGYGLGYYAQAMADVSGERPPSGFGSALITGIWGWEPIPDEVIQAIAWDMEDTAIADASLLADTVRTYRKMGLPSVEQGGLSLDLTGVPVLSDRVALLLRDFVWEGRVGALA